jgi:hypothetical protein
LNESVAAGSAAVTMTVLALRSTRKSFDDTMDLEVGDSIVRRLAGMKNRGQGEFMR